MRRIAFVIATLFAAPLRADNPPAALLTVAESSDFRATARHEEVVGLMRRLADHSALARLSSMGRSGEGREIPLMILADPPVSSPEEAARFAKDGSKLVVLAIGNIHAGEVDGKEALPMLARELILERDPPLLRDLILLIAPIYNCDGNERVSKDNRPGQLGPEEGMGRRENAEGLDLNRDFVKLEAPETQGLVAVMNAWDPAIFIDTHTTDGCYHRYVITYDGAKAPAGDAGIVAYTRDEMFPAITRLCDERYHLPTFWYGDFNREHTRWETYPAHARYGTTYYGLRNRLSILSEGYSYAPYKTRVLGTRDFVRACLEFAAANKARIHALLREADRRTIAAGESPSETGRVAIRSRGVAPREKVSARGFVEVSRDGRVVPTEEPKDYQVELWNQFEAASTVSRPYAYVLPPECAAAARKTAAHGVRVERLTDPVELAVETYEIEKVDIAERAFQKHRLASVEVTPRGERRRLAAGSFVVRTAQPLGTLACYLLEPACEDGLTTWNYFDEALKAGETFPVFRIREKPETALPLAPLP